MINERIQFIIDQRFNGNASAFSRKIGVSQSTIKDIVGIKAAKPSYETLHAIASDETLNISPEWLLLGKGDMTAKTSNNTDTTKLIDAISSLSSSNNILASSNCKLVDSNSVLIKQLEGGMGAQARHANAV